VRVAGVSALLTFVILCLFAVVVGQLTSAASARTSTASCRRRRGDLSTRIRIHVDPNNRILSYEPPLDVYAAPEHAVIRVLSQDGRQLATSTRRKPPRLARACSRRRLQRRDSHGREISVGSSH